MQDKTEYEDRLLRLIATYQTQLMRMAFYFLKDQMLSEDAVQETFLKYIKAFICVPSLTRKRRGYTKSPSTPFGICCAA